MKKYIIKAVILMFVVVAVSSCNENLDIWDSQTLNYSGRYMVRTFSEDGKTVLHDFKDNEFRIFNTADNVANNIWIDAGDKGSPKLKSKFILEGSSESFKSTETEFYKLSNNLNAVIPPESTEKTATADASPSAVGQAIEQDRDNIRVAIMEGKVLFGKATTPGKNVADSIYIKFKIYSGKVVFKSELVPVKERKDPDVEEFRWIYDSATVDTSKDKEIIISGHSYTGFPNDSY